LDVIGKREVHILSVIPGGVVYYLKPQEREELLREAENAYAITLEALNMGKELFEKNWTDFKKAGDCETHYMALTKSDAIDFYSGEIRIIDTEGKTVADVAPSDYLNHIEEKTSSWTYAKFAYLKILGWPQGIVQVGPTARMNVNSWATTQVANGEMQEFKNKYGNPAHATILLDYARLIDLMYAVERAKELLEDQELTRGDTRVKVERRSGKGVGVVEAPRGTLAHEYVLDKDGRLEQLKLMIPTQINNLAINLNVKDAATEFIRNGEIKPGLLNRIEMITRAYDPCIKCATRQTGEKLRVEIRDPRGRLVTAL
jgi:coenzyme F420-reducing hydrogenase alpha subunit